MFKHRDRDENRVTLQQLADINNSGLAPEPKWAQSDPILDTADSLLGTKSYDTVDSETTVRETQSMDDCLLDVPNNNVYKPRYSREDDIYVDSDSDSPECPRDSRLAGGPLLHPSVSVNSKKESKGKCPVLCLILFVAILAAIIAILVYVFAFREKQPTIASISAFLNVRYPQSFHGQGLTVWTIESTNSTSVSYALVQGAKNEWLANTTVHAEGDQVWTWLQGTHIQLNLKSSPPDPDWPLELQTLGNQIEQPGFKLSHLVRRETCIHLRVYEDNPQAYALLSITSNQDLHIGGPS